MADIEDGRHGVFVAQDNWLQMVQPEMSALSNLASSDYGRLFQQSAALVEAGSERASMVPATLFLVRSSLRILTHEETSFQLPLEIQDRSEIAETTAEALAHTHEIQKVIGATYWAAGFPANHPDLSEYDLWEMLTKGVFSDTSAVTGGAFKLLQEQAPEVQDRRAVIQRSSGLLAMSRLIDDHMPYVYAEIGDPYVNIKNLSLVTDDQGLKARFKPEVLAALREKFLSPDGCPAAKQKGLNSRGNLMHEEAKPVIAYLTPPGATVDLYKEVDAEPDVVLHIVGVLAKRERLAALQQAN